MRRFLWLIGLTLSACSASGGRPTAASRVPRVSQDTFSGVVVDETAKPLAGVEVMVCAGVAACDLVAEKLRLSPESIAQVLSTQPPWLATQSALAVTDSDGRWHATVTSADPLATILVVATAPGRELIKKGGSLPLASSQLAEITLRPAVPIELALDCGSATCGGKVIVEIEHVGRYIRGTRIEHVVAGTYAFHVIQDFGEPGERRGGARADSSRGQPIAVTMLAAGTGKSIRGTAIAHLPHEDRTALWISASCGPDQIYRHVPTDAEGAFELVDVGPPPCDVAITSAFGDAHEEPSGPRAKVTIDALPADSVRLEAEVRDRDRQIR